MHQSTDRILYTMAFCYTSHGALAGMKILLLKKKNVIGDEMNAKNFIYDPKWIICF